MKIPELEKVGNSIIFTGDILNVYIPKSMLDKNLAVYNGEFIHTMGIFIFEITNEKNMEEGKAGRFHKLLMPNSIDFQYSDTYNFTGSVDGMESDSYEVFQLINGNQFIANVIMQQSSEEVIMFVKSLHSGYIPKIVPYHMILGLYHEVLGINKVSLQSPSIIYELIVSELCRFKTDLSLPYRLAANKKVISPYAYKNINLNRLPSLNSTFAGLTFEDMTNSITMSLARTKTGGKETASPLEKIIKY